MIDPKVLVYDIETSPIIAYAWGLRDQNLAVNQIKKDWHVLAFAAKWLGDPASRVIYRDQRNAKLISDDRVILQDIWDLLDRADIVITQNGQRFDSPKLNARFIMHGMRPPSPYRHLDTYQIARQVANFTSNKLEFLTDKLCTKYKKLQHEKFPGFKLWTECLAGNRAAWEEMKRYNIHDVLATEELYMKLRAWAPRNMPNVYGIAPSATVCRVCGDDQLQRRGIDRTLSAAYQRHQCMKCGAWTRGAKLI